MVAGIARPLRRPTLTQRASRPAIPCRLAPWRIVADASRKFTAAYFTDGHICPQLKFRNSQLFALVRISVLLCETISISYLHSKSSRRIIMRVDDLRAVPVAVRDQLQRHSIGSASCRAPIICRQNRRIDHAKRWPLAEAADEMDQETKSQK